MRKEYGILRRIAGLLLIVLAVVFVMPSGVYASEKAQGRTIRVGWHDAPFFITDKDGRCSGYAYEYLSKLAAYTGWEYEYVEGSWTDLLQMLKDGQIDMMSNISYTDERARDILYASIPMGTESYYIFVSPDNTKITAEDYSSLNGMTVGVAQGSIQRDIFVKWADAHSVSINLIEINGHEEEVIRTLDDEMDAYVTMDIYADPEFAVPVCKIGSSDYYFAVSKECPDLQAQLDVAMNRIQDENKNYNLQLHDKYLTTETERYLDPRERNWLSEHGAIRVGYQDNYLAFCAEDPKTGNLTGALRDYLAFVSGVMANEQLDFEPVSYPTAGAAMDALKSGEVDCVFPSNLTDYDAELLDVVMSPPIMHSEMDAIVRASEQKEFVRKEDVTVAVNQGNTNYDMFLAAHYPTWKRAYFVDTPMGLDAVANGSADCVIISNYRFSNISKQCEKLHLTTVYTGVDMDYCFALRKGDIELYSIMAKAVNTVPDAVINSALTYYSTEDVKVSFLDLLKENLLIVLAVIVVVLLVILVLLLKSIKAERKVVEEERLLKALNKKIFVDPLTSVRNKGAFDGYLKDIQEKLDDNETVEFAIGVFDCDNLKLINDQYGHDKGDIYIKQASRLICKIFEHSPVFRIGGDEFATVLLKDDYDKRDELLELFEKQRTELCAKASDPWEEPRVSMGIAVYDSVHDASVSDTVRRADKLMYENKRQGKAKNLDRPDI
ncbi:MAG: transporter substrate-binding domain-containing protein [Lachnospiraceae bacterium]|nr:transporter substrate-binding domain-containing protein [Lachnospiraceae bacterium]